MYKVIEYDGQYGIVIEDMEEMRPIYVHYDKALVDKITDMLNISYDIGYKHGAELGYE